MAPADSSFHVGPSSVPPESTSHHMSTHPAALSPPTISKQSGIAVRTLDLSLNVAAAAGPRHAPCLDLQCSSPQPQHAPSAFLSAASLESSAHGSFLNLHELKACSPDRSDFLLPDDCLTLPDDIAEPAFLSGHDHHFDGSALSLPELEYALPSAGGATAAPSFGRISMTGAGALSLGAPSSPSSDSCCAEFQKTLYCLARVDADSGTPMRAATPEELDELSSILHADAFFALDSQASALASDWCAGGGTAVAATPCPAAFQEPAFLAMEDLCVGPFPSSTLGDEERSGAGEGFDFGLDHRQTAQGSGLYSRAAWQSVGSEDDDRLGRRGSTSPDELERYGSTLAAGLERYGSTFAIGVDCDAGTETGSASADEAEGDGEWRAPNPAAPVAVPATPGPPKMPHHKSGGPCDHCHATDSPQWRRGPANKPVLCNACGTRFRRTNCLGPPCSMAIAKGGRGKAPGPAAASGAAKKNKNGKRVSPPAAAAASAATRVKARRSSEY